MYKSNSFISNVLETFQYDKIIITIKFFKKYSLNCTLNSYFTSSENSNKINENNTNLYNLYLP